MSEKGNFSRRDFIKSSALATAVAGTATFTGCRSDSGMREYPLRQFLGKVSTNSSGVSGLLFSQLGYELGLPVRIIIRLPEKEQLSASATCKLISSDGATLNTNCKYWGEIWGSHWWVAAFANIQKEDAWDIVIIDSGQVVYADQGLKTAKRTLWEQTIEWSSVDMLERRKHFTKVGAGWQDAGALWVESPAQSGMIISLEDLLEKASEVFDQSFIDRIEEQITVGCDYLVMTQKKAKVLGYAEGSFTHDLHGHEHDILPNDANKAVVALMRAYSLLSEKYSDKKKEYLEAGEKAYSWLITKAKPMGEHGYEKFQRGLSQDTKIPTDEWVTRDLVMLCWASLEKWKVDKSELAKSKALEYAQQVMDRQVKEKDSNGFYGHFLEFASMKHTESAWVHGIVPSPKGSEFGTDMGGFYPNYLMPIVEMLQLWSDHEDAVQWKSMLSSFVEGYLKPACNANPFNLIPLGIYGKEGPIWFCGTFHGSNAIYGFTAALALDLSKLLDDAELIDIAYGNLQWVAGLNGGITKEGLAKGCVVFSADVPESVALPASMICHIGKRWAGTWFQTRGVVCNGFSVGEQFKYDTEPVKENDGPHSLTDEDWIPHSAGWVAGLIRLNEVIDKI